MSDQVQYRRGSTAQHAVFTGAVGELTIDTDKSVAVVHDGVTAGGRPMARADQAFAAPAGTSAVGDLYYSTGGQASARLADVAAGSVLVSGGVGQPPAWATALPNGMTASTPAANDNTTKVATTAFVAAAITALVASSPAALDTLKELADAIGDDPNFATTVTNLIAGKAAKGANSDITSLGGLTTALSIGQGGTGATSAAAALQAIGGVAATLLGAANGVATLDGNSKVPSAQLPTIPIAGGGTGAATAAAALAALGAPAEVAPSSFTPVATFATPGDLTMAYDAGGQVGFSYRVGKLVFVYASLVFTPTYTTAAGILRIAGLPAAANAGAQSFLQVLQFSGATAITWPGGGTQLSGQIPAGASYCQVSGTKSGSTPATASVTTCASGNKITLVLQGCYLSA